MKIKTGDKVKIISGDDRGATGKVVRTAPAKNRIVVEGINLHKKHARQRGANKPGGIIEIALPVDVSNVQLVCPKCGEATRVKHHRPESAAAAEKHRICRRCGEMID